MTTTTATTNKTRKKSTTRSTKQTTKSKSTKKKSPPQNPISNQLSLDKINQTPDKIKATTNQIYQINCQQEVLNNALTFCKQTINNKGDKTHLHPILNNLLLTINKDYLTIIGTNLSTTLRSTLTITSSNEFKIALPANLLASAIEQLQPGKILLELQVELQNNEDEQEENTTTYTLHIHQENLHYEIYGCDPKEFPPIDPPKDNPNTTSISLPNLLQSAITMSLFAAKPKDTAPILGGIHLSLHEKSNALTIYSTDGHRLMQTYFKYTPQNKQTEAKNTQLKTTLPKSALKFIPKPTINGDLHLLHDPQTRLTSLSWHTQLNQDNDDNETYELTQEIICHSLEGEYPDCKQLLNQFKFPHNITIDRSQLTQALHKIAALSDKDNNIIQISISSKTIELKLERESGKSHISLSLPTTSNSNPPDEITITLNLNYILDILKTLTTNSIQFNYNGPLNPILIQPKSSKSKLHSSYLLTPIGKKEQ